MYLDGPTMLSVGGLEPPFGYVPTISEVTFESSLKQDVMVQRPWQNTLMYRDIVCVIEVERNAKTTPDFFAGCQWRFA